MIEGEFRDRFEELNVAGKVARDSGDHQQSLACFEEADAWADEHGAKLDRIHALTPAARALWSMGCYDEAIAKLETAASFAKELDLPDEEAITASNIGRIAAVKIVQTVPVEQQKVALQSEAVPQFEEAYNILKKHPHLYYRYANAHHGSIVAALAGERKLVSKLVVEGFRVVFRKSDEPYDQKATCQINRKGLLQLFAAAAMIPLAERTPVLARIARHKLVR